MQDNLDIRLAYMSEGTCTFSHIAAHLMIQIKEKLYKCTSCLNLHTFNVLFCILFSAFVHLSSYHLRVETNYLIQEGKGHNVIVFTALDEY